MNIPSTTRPAFLYVNAGAGILLSPTGNCHSKTNEWCWSGISGCLPWLRSPPKDIGMSQEMVNPKLYLSNQQPRRETPMIMLYPPPITHSRPGQPLQRHDSILCHHPGGLADEYYLPICPEPSVARPRLKEVSYLLADIPTTEAGVHNLLKRLGPSQPSTVPQEHKSGLGFTTVVGPVIIPLGEQISSFVTALLMKTPVFLVPQAEARPVPMPHLVSKSMPPPQDDRLDDIPIVRPAKRRMVISDASSMEVRIHGDIQSGIIAKANHRWTLSDLFPAGHEDTDKNDDTIPMARPTSRRRPLSDCSSIDSTTMAQPATIRRPISDGSTTFSLPTARPVSHRRALSDCFSVGSTSSYSTYNTDSDTDSLAKIPLADRSDNPIFPNPYRSNTLALNEQNVRMEKYVGRREGPGRVAVLVEATTCKSLTAELCWASDSEDEDEEEGVISKRDSFSVYEPRGCSSEDIRREASLASHHQQSAVLVQASSSLWYDEPGWGEDQVWSALLLAGDEQACLARFAEYWDNPYAQPFEQSLFADFDANFSSEAILEIPEALPEMQLVH